MSFSFAPNSADPTTAAIARVRNHLNDVGDGSGGGGTEGTNYFLSDERIAVFLAGEADVALAAADISRMAAAAGLDALATNEAYVQKVQSTLGLETNGAKTSEAIRAHATALRRQVSEGRARAESVSVPTGGSFVVELRRAAVD